MSGMSRICEPEQTEVTTLSRSITNLCYVTTHSKLQMELTPLPPLPQTLTLKIPPYVPISLDKPSEPSLLHLIVTCNGVI